MRFYPRLPSTPGLSGFMDEIQELGDDVLAFGSNILASASSAAQWIGDKARTGVKNFRANVVALRTRYNELLAHPPNFAQSPGVWAEYDELKNNVSSTLSKAEWVEGQIVAIENQTGITLNGLGFLPAVAIPAAVVAAIVGCTYLIAKSMDLISDYFGRNAYIEQRVKDGVSAAQAAGEYDKNNQKGGLFGDLSKLLWPVAIVVIAPLVLKELRR